jgi:hypothetical protein
MKEVLMPPRNPRNNVALVSMSPPVSERDVLPLKLTIELSKVIIILPSNVQCSTELCWVQAGTDTTTRVHAVHVSPMCLSETCWL